MLIWLVHRIKNDVDFAKEMNFDVGGQVRKPTRDRTIKKLLKSPGLMVSATRFSKTIFFIMRS